MRITKTVLNPPCFMIQMIFADLHLHGRYSQATSKQLDIPNLAKWAKVKGINLLGTGDFTHPKWIEEINRYLKEGDDGVLRTNDGFPFILTTEISLIYSQGGMGRRIHNLVLAPDLATVKKITEWLLTKGRVDYDGRPIFKIPCPEFVGSLRQISEEIEVIPAHIWTPWFSMFGSKSGFDTVKECFGDQAGYIHAFETGLSSDPPMNWRLSQLDRLQILSFSDLHSYWPWRLGREATMFDCSLNYKAILNAIRKGEGLAGTVEVDPNYGKYHLDGHRRCNVCMHPKEAIRHNKICPVCKRPLTIGVQARVEELADRPEGYTPKDAKPFYTLIPLSDIIANITGKAVTTKAVWEHYNKLLEAGDSELDVLINLPREKLEAKAPAEIVDAVMLNRDGKVKVRPGYDGEYGVPVFGEEKVFERPVPPESGHSTQTGLGSFMRQ